MSTVYHRPAAPSSDDSYVQPLFADRCQAVFPSPATDYAEQELDLNSYCISRPAATFFLRASGESMNQAGVQNGDLLVVDRAEKPQHGDIVTAEIDGEFSVKRLLLRPRPALEPVSDSPDLRNVSSVISEHIFSVSSGLVFTVISRQILLCKRSTAIHRRMETRLFFQ